MNTANAAAANAYKHAWKKLEGISYEILLLWMIRAEWDHVLPEDVAKVIHLSIGSINSCLLWFFTHVKSQMLSVIINLLCTPMANI